MEKPDNIAPDAREKRSSTINRLLTFLAYPVSLLAGYAVAHTSVRESAYEKVKSKGGFLDLSEKFRTEHQGDIKSTLSNILTKSEFSALSATNRRLHDEAVQARMVKLGIDKFTSKWHYINRIDKQKAIIDGLTITGIALGAILTVANSKSIIDTIFGHSAQQENER